MFNIQDKYTNAVANFPFVEWKEDLELTIHSDDLNGVVKEVAEKIIAASQMRPMFSMMAQREFSLRDTCYLVVQDTDRRDALDTPDRIANAPEKAKAIVSHVAKKLSADFVQVNADDLKVLSLLFGVHRICDLAKEVIIFLPELSKLEQMEADLNKLIALRSQYPAVPSETMSEMERNFLAQVDAKIVEQTELLNAFRLSLATNEQIAK
jgi:hypothetical protein